MSEYYSSDHLVTHYESCPHFFKKWTQECNCDAWGRAGLKMLGMLNEKEERLEQVNELLEKCLPHLPIHIKAEVEKWTLSGE